MKTTMSTKPSKWSIGLCAAFVLAGCNTQRSNESTVLVVQDASRPMLTSSRDREITLFGGLPRRGEAPYVGRSRGAMLQHSFTREGADFDCQLDSTGQRFVFASTRHSENADLYMKSVDGTAVTQLTADPSSDIHPALSPDDKMVAFASNRSGNWDIWIMSIDGQQPIQVTRTPMDEVHPSWSPDGKRIVYSALPRANGQWELWIAPAVAHAPSTFIGYGVFPQWSPVDDTILYQRSRERGTRWYSIWTLALVDGEPRYPTEVASSADSAMISPAWSRDGQRIAFTTVTTKSPMDPEFGSTYEVSDIWVIDADGGSRIRLTDGHSANFSPAWAPDGRVFFTSRRSDYENVWSIMPSTGGGTSTFPMAGAATPRAMTTSATAGGS